MIGVALTFSLPISVAVRGKFVEPPVGVGADLCEGSHLSIIHQGLDALPGFAFHRSDLVEGGLVSFQDLGSLRRVPSDPAIAVTCRGVLDGW